MRVTLLLSVFSFVACSASDAPPAATADSGTSLEDTSKSETASGGDFLDPTAGGDAPPPDLPAAKAFDGSADVVPDLSCAGKPMPTSATRSEGELHTVEIGGLDADRVGDVDVELFLSNSLGTASDAAGKSSTAATTAESGVLGLNLPTGYVTFRTKAGAGFIDTIGYDYYLEEGKPTLVQIAPANKIALTEILSTEAGFEHTPGTSRYVAQVTDCQRRPIAGVFVALESDGKIVVPVKTSPGGARRNFFGDNALPSTAKLTTRSGVVAFVDVPVGSKMRAVGWAKIDGALTPIVSRKVTLPPDRVVTSLIAPYDSKP